MRQNRCNACKSYTDFTPRPFATCRAPNGSIHWTDMYNHEDVTLTCVPDTNSGIKAKYHCICRPHQFDVTVLCVVTEKSPLSRELCDAVAAIIQRDTKDHIHIVYYWSFAHVKHASFCLKATTINHHITSEHRQKRQRKVFTSLLMIMIISCSNAAACCGCFYCAISLRKGRDVRTSRVAGTIEVIRDIVVNPFLDGRFFIEDASIAVVAFEGHWKSNRNTQNHRPRWHVSLYVIFRLSVWTRM